MRIAFRGVEEQITNLSSINMLRFRCYVCETDSSGDFRGGPEGGLVKKVAFAEVGESKEPKD